MAETQQGAAFLREHPAVGVSVEELEANQGSIRNSLGQNPLTHSSSAQVSELSVTAGPPERRAWLLRLRAHYGRGECEVARRFLTLQHDHKRPRCANAGDRL